MFKNLFLFSLFTQLCFVNHSFAVDSKRKRDDVAELANKENEPLKKPRLSCSLDSPTTKEKKYLSPVRRQMVEARYNNTLGSPYVRKTYQENNPENYFTQCIKVKGKTVYQADFMFNPYAKVLSNEGTWETNLERMKKGQCPVSYKGIVSGNQQTLLPHETIRKIQNSYRLELHHITQKDTGTDEDPLYELTHAAHMGDNARLVIKIDPETQKMRIMHSSLSAEAALTLCGKDEFTLTNVLHFRTGGSLINRPAFSEWRSNYWKERAAAIERDIKKSALTSTL